MAWDNCKNCKQLRKVDVISTPNGWRQPACTHCGDPSYLEAYQEPTEKFDSLAQMRAAVANVPDRDQHQCSWSYRPENEHGPAEFRVSFKIFHKNDAHHFVVEEPSLEDIYQWMQMVEEMTKEH